MTRIPKQPAQNKNAINYCSALKQGLFIILAILSSSYSAIAQNQPTASSNTKIQYPTSSPTPDLNQLTDDYFSYSGFTYLPVPSQIEQDGESGIIDIESDFLDLTPEQEKGNLNLIENVVGLYMQNDFEYRQQIGMFKKRLSEKPVNKKPSAEEIKHREMAENYASQLKDTSRFGLKKILGNKKYQQYINYLLWCRAYEEMKRDINKIDQSKYFVLLNERYDKSLQDAGVSDPGTREQILGIVYQDYKDFYEAFNQPQLKNRWTEQAYTIVTGFEKNRSKRRDELIGLLGDKLTNEGVQNEFGLILNSLFSQRTVKPVFQINPVANQKLVRSSNASGRMFYPNSEVEMEMDRQEKKIQFDSKNGVLTKKQAKELMDNVMKVETEMFSISKEQKVDHCTAEENARFLQELKTNADQIP